MHGKRTVVSLRKSQVRHQRLLLRDTGFILRYARRNLPQ